MNNSAGLSSVISWLRRRDTKLVPWSKSQEKCKISRAFLQLFCDFHAKTRTSYRHLNHFTNEWFNVALCSYFFTSRERHALRTAMGDASQMNTSIRFSSFVWWLQHIEEELVRWSNSHDNWFIVVGPLQLFSHSDANTRSSSHHQRNRTND